MGPFEDEDSLDLRHIALTSADRCALVVEGQAYSYADLARRVEQVLASWPLPTQTCAAPIALHTPIALRSTPTLLGLLHFYAALALNVPCLLVHPRFSERQTADALERVGAHAYFDGESWTTISAQTSRAVHAQASLLLATSGSTGTFKIVQHSHATLRAAARASALNLPFEANDRWLLSLPYAHVGGVSILVRCLLARTPVVVAHGSFADPAFIHSVEQQGCTLYSLVPTQLHDLVSYCQSGATRPQALRHVLVGGAPTALRLRRLAHHQGLRALFTYGMTEAGSQISTQRPNVSELEPQTVDSGYPLAGMELRVDDESRLSVRGPSLMLGYVGEAPLRPTDTDEPGWLVTNDRAIIHEDGRVQILGRTDHVLITGGENVDPEWVEQILGEHPWVQEVALCGLPDARWGQRLVALVVPSSQAQMEAISHELLSFARQHLPQFAVFKELFLVSQLPRLGIGKLDRKAALEIASQVQS